jgi:uncharacterized protein YukE
MDEEINMAGSVGAELSTLQALHGTFTQNAAEALSIKGAVNKGMGSAVWTGKFADDFRSAWTEYSKNLDKLNDALTQAAADVKTNHNNIANATGEPTM